MRDNRLLLAGDFNFGESDTIVAAVTVVTNTGTTETAPIFTFTGPGTVYQIQNVTTGDVLYFNLTLNAGEVAILNLTPGRIRFYSNFRSNLLNTILPGSALATFRLMPGANNLSVFIAGSVTSATAVTVRWRPAYWSLDGVLELSD